MKIAKITLFLQLRKIFDYLIPESIISKVIVGIRVIVPFRNKSMVGFIIEITDKTSIPHNKLKEIIDIIDFAPIFSKPLYSTLSWASEYYQSSIGAVLDAALPKHYKENKPIPKPIRKKITKKITSINNIDSKKIVLNAQQQNIIDNLLARTNKFNVSLIEGVTGSGKTEVYLQLVNTILQANQQVLILVPEVGLTPQTLQRFSTRFPGIKIALLHSYMTKKQRYINWQQAKDGSAKIILGTRSACFVPLLNPGLFIVDEEHDISFKQRNYLNYTARDFLIMRAKFENCPIILGTATPSLETLYNVNINKYFYYNLPNRAISVLPNIDIIDIRHKKLRSGLSNLVVTEIKKYLDSNYQVLLFINRRGYAPILKCYKCQFIFKCIDCDSNMILHLYTNKIHCHHCHKSSALPTLCYNCSSNNLMPIGQGTEKIEELFQELFPTAKTARIDKDTMGGNKDNFSNTVAAILNQEINLLIGTQMIAKGHHFPNLGLVVIIDIDNALFSSDFRATERIGQLIIQVAGRAGRERLGKVLLQTCYPNNPLIQAIADYNYQKFTSILLEERQSANLPPFSHQILWRAEAARLNSCLKFLSNVKELAIQMLPEITTGYKIKIFGPIPALLTKKKRKFHARLLFQHNNRIALKNLTKKLVEFLSYNNTMASTQWSIDVDPKEIF